VRDAERKLAHRARSLAVRLAALEEQRALRTRQAELARQLAESVGKFAERGEVSALDAAQAQVDSQRMILESARIETERVTLLGELRPLLALAPGDPLTLTGALPEIGSPALAGDWRQRADFRLAKKTEEAASAGVSLAKARKWEDASAGFFIEGERMEDAPEGLDRTGFAGLRFSLPLPFWNKNQGEIAEKTAGARRAELETKALASQIANEAAAAKAEMAAIAKLAADTAAKLLPLVVEQAEKLEAAYQKGQTDLITVLRIREQRLQIETAALDAKRDWNLARIRYEAATGN
jgi:cobalt-zinc-cadmium efflux system outer membrane protein